MSAAILRSADEPRHPGEVLREEVMPELGLTVKEAALQLGVTRAALSRVLNGRAAVSIDMARRLEAWLSEVDGTRADALLLQQLAYDLWQAKRKPIPAILPAQPLA